jgi:hypothetical protein
MKKVFNFKKRIVNNQFIYKSSTVLKFFLLFLLINLFYFI